MYNWKYLISLLFIHWWKILSDWVSLYGNAAMLNRNFSDLCITGAVIASSFLVWTGSYSLHYLWCNDSIQMEKSDQVESELWVLIRSSCSMKAASLSLGLKTSKHKFLILKSILNLWDINAEIANCEMQTHVCFIINESKVFIIRCYWEKNNTQAFYLLFPYESTFFFFFSFWPWIFFQKENLLPIKFYSFRGIFLNFDLNKYATTILRVVIFNVKRKEDILKWIPANINHMEISFCFLMTLRHQLLNTII